MRFNETKKITTVLLCQMPLTLAYNWTLMNRFGSNLIIDTDEHYILILVILDSTIMKRLRCSG